MVRVAGGDPSNASLAAVSARLAVSQATAPTTVAAMRTVPARAADNAGRATLRAMLQAVHCTIAP